MAVSFLNLVDDDGSNTVGSLMDKAELQLLLRGSFVTSTSTGAVNNWAPPIDGHTFIAWNGAADATFSGLAGGLSGLTATVKNITATKLATFLHQSGSSSAGNKFTTVAGLTTTIGPGGSITVRYDGTDWQVIGVVLGAVVQTTTLTGTQNDFALTAGCNVLRCNNATLLTLTGFVAGYDGQRVVIESVGAGQVDLSHQAAGSAAANRVICYATSSNTSLAAGVGTAEITSDVTATRWRLTAHEQGAWITPAYVAGHFTGNGAMTWTVDAGDVSQMRYRLHGRTVTAAFNLATTTIGGTLNTLLQIGNGQWGGFTIAATAQNALAFANDGTVRAAYSRANTSATLIELTTTAATAWAAVTNGGYFAGEIVFEVT